MDWKRFGFIAIIIIILFGAVVLVGRVKQRPLLTITSMLATTIAVATPLTLGALSGVFCERAGVVNIGIEGMMLAAAFFGWLGAIYMFHIFDLGVGLSIASGVLFAVLTGGLMALLHGSAFDHLQSGPNHRRNSHQHPCRGADWFSKSPVVFRQRKCVRWHMFPVRREFSPPYTSLLRNILPRFAANLPSVLRTSRPSTAYSTKNPSP